MPAGYRIRRRRPADDQTLLAIENRAAQLFRAYGQAAVADAPIPDVGYLNDMMKGQEVWVAVDHADKAAGFAVAAPLGDFLHLGELSVDPVHGRRGIGRALVRTVTEAARRAKLAGTSLTTFREIPFNAPFYSRLGFVELPLDDAPPELRDRFHTEVPDGVDPRSRVLMICRDRT